LDYRVTWIKTVVLLTIVALVPLFFAIALDYKVTRDAVLSENLLRTARTTSNARRSVAFYLEERLAALDLVTKILPSLEFGSKDRFMLLLDGFKFSFGGFTDLGIIDQNGVQVAYAGPFDLEGKNYRSQTWFQEAMEKGSYISDVFLGYRDKPHLALAVRFITDSGKKAVLRATIDTERLSSVLAGMDLSGDGDAVIVNRKGILQVPSRYYGGVLDRLKLPLPEYSPSTEAVVLNMGKEQLIQGYAFVENTPFILMVIKRKALLMDPLDKAEQQLAWIFGLSVIIILVVIIGVATRMVGRVFEADRTRFSALQKMEHANRMASIGRLAAGVAHEINNPLAIISEKAGLLKDLFTFRQEYQGDDRLLNTIDSILGSVERCGIITKRLLGFARQGHTDAQPLCLRDVVKEVLVFLGKEAEYRSIEVALHDEQEVPEIVSDRSRLQQIFLNLINNAFQALGDGGRLDIAFSQARDDMVEISFADTGCGISPENLEKIFEPFFSTRKGTGGTGLGLAITYGLVRELGGDIRVKSVVGQGTVFTVRLPVKKENKG
jgi:signal transduction histidine kinase